MTDSQYLNAVKHWLEHTVIGLNLCPFAKREFINNQIRFTISDAITTQQLLETLQAELLWLGKHSKMETTLIIHPKVLEDFVEYNDFLDEIDSFLNRED